MQSASASDCRVSSPGVAQEYDVHMTTASPTNLDTSLICSPYNSEAAHRTDEMPAIVIKANACEDSTKRYMYAVCYQTIQGTVCADSIGRRLLSSRIVGVVGFASLLKGLLLCCCPTGASLVLAYIAIRICTVHCHACHSVSCRRWVVNSCAAVVYFTLGWHWAVLVAVILAVSPRALLWWPSQTDSSAIFAKQMAHVDKMLNTQQLRGIRDKVDMSSCSDPAPVLGILQEGYDELDNHVNLYSDFQKTQAGIVSDIKAELAKQVSGEPCAKSMPRSVLLQDIGNLQREYFWLTALPSEWQNVKDVFTIRRILREGRDSISSQIAQIQKEQMGQKQSLIMQKVYEHVRKQLHLQQTGGQVAMKRESELEAQQQQMQKRQRTGVAALLCFLCSSVTDKQTSEVVDSRNAIDSFRCNNCQDICAGVRYTIDAASPHVADVLGQLRNRVCVLRNVGNK